MPVHKQRHSLLSQAPPRLIPRGRAHCAARADAYHLWHQRRAAAASFDSDDEDSPEPPSPCHCTWHPAAEDNLEHARARYCMLASRLRGGMSARACNMLAARDTWDRYRLGCPRCSCASRVSVVTCLECWRVSGTGIAASAFLTVSSPDHCAARSGSPVPPSDGTGAKATCHVSPRVRESLSDPSGEARWWRACAR